MSKPLNNDAAFEVIPAQPEDMQALIGKFQEAVQAALETPLPDGKMISVSMTYKAMLIPELTVNFTNQKT
jgi:hypothetical protein